MKNTSKFLLKYAGITLGALLYAAGVSLFLDPNNLSPGGVMGIAMILHRFLVLPTGTFYFLINIPIVIFGLVRFGTRFILSTFYAIGASSLFTNALAPLGPLTTEPLLAALTASVLLGVGLGLILKMGATTGGTDIVVKALRQRFPHLKTGTLFLVLDVLIIAAFTLVFGDLNTALYAAINVAATDKIMDLVLYGSDEAKLAIIISDRPNRIAERLLSELEVGVTFLSGTGAYTGKEKQVILCAVTKRVGPRVEAIVRVEDPQAFLIFSNTTEIYGEGHKDILADKL